MTYSNSVCLGNWFEDRVQKSSTGPRVLSDYGYRIFDTDASRSWGLAAENGENEGSKVRSRAMVLKKLAGMKREGGFCMAQQKTYHESVSER